jgi:hypothetical protein
MCVLHNGQPKCCPDGICLQTVTTSLSKSSVAKKTSSSPTSPTESDTPISCEANPITVFDPVVTSFYIVKTDCDCPAIVGEAIGSTTSESYRFGFNCTIPVSTTSTTSPQNLAFTNSPTVTGIASSSAGRINEGRMGSVALILSIIAGATIGTLIVLGY